MQDRTTETTDSGAYVAVSGDWRGPFCAQCLDPWYQDQNVAYIGVADHTDYAYASDTPEHCTICGVLIITTLTRDGLEYVAEYVLLDSASEIVRLWAATWNDELAELG